MKPQITGAVNNFPVKIETCEIPVVETSASEMYTHYTVAANGFVIAVFVDEQSMKDYLNYLKKFGFAKFPKKIMDILRAQHDKTCLNEIKSLKEK